MALLIALSVYWKNNLFEFCPETKIFVIPNGVNVFSFNRNAFLRNNSPFPRDRIVVSFLGSVTREKGVYDVLKAIPLVTKYRKNCLFAFAGRAESEVKTAFDVEGIKEHVIFLGEVFYYINYNSKKDPFTFS